MISRKITNSTFGRKAPNSLLEVATIMYQTPIFSIETFIILSIQIAIMFCLASTLCENGGILKIMLFISILIPMPQHVSKAK
jgi:hypothetical protein